MSTFVLSEPCSGEGELILGAIAREIDQLRIYFSVSTVGATPFENYRYYVPRSFHGRIQLLSGEAVVESVEISHYSQLIYSRDRCCVASFEDRCRKYVCLAQKLDWIGRAISLASPQVIPVIGLYPLSSDAANYGEELYADSPTSLAWVLEPGVTGTLTLVGDAPSSTACTPGFAELPVPEGCRSPQSPPPPVGSCAPTVPPPGGGGSLFP